MVEIQERVAKVEGRVEEHARMLTDIASAIRHLEVRMDQPDKHRCRDPGNTYRE
jgi:hypothetical protein